MHAKEEWKQREELETTLKLLEKKPFNWGKSISLQQV